MNVRLVLVLSNDGNGIDMNLSWPDLVFLPINLWNVPGGRLYKPDEDVASDLNNESDTTSIQKLGEQKVVDMEKKV